METEQERLAKIIENMASGQEAENNLKKREPVPLDTNEEIEIEPEDLLFAGAEPI